MKNHLHFLLSFALVITFMSSCSLTIEKRLYRKGFHVDHYSYHHMSTPTQQNSVELTPNSHALILPIKNNGHMGQEQNPHQNNISSTDIRPGQRNQQGSIQKRSEYSNPVTRNDSLKTSSCSPSKIKPTKYAPHSVKAKKKIAGGLVINLLALIFSFTGFILGLLGWILPGTFIGIFILFLLGFLFSLTGIILSGIGLRMSFKGLGIPALLLGIITLLACIGGMIFAIIFL